MEKNMSIRRRDPLIVLTATIMLVLAFLGFRMPEAHAAGDCIGMIRQQESTWTQYTEFAQPEVGAGVHMVGKPVYQYIFLQYKYCKSPYRMVAPIGGLACWRLPEGGNHTVFDGVRFDPYYYDNNESINPGPFTVGDDDDNQKCEEFTVPRDLRKWLEVDQGARYNIWSQVKRNGTYGFMDEGAINWKHGSSETMPFDPMYDEITRDWHW